MTRTVTRQPAYLLPPLAHNETGRWQGEVMIGIMTTTEMPIFTRTFDFLGWLLPVSNHFPKVRRHDFTHRLLDAAFDLRERLEEANQRRGDARRERLERADEALSRVRVYLRLAEKLGWLSSGQYGHAAEQVAEIGRLLGGWRKVSHD